MYSYKSKYLILRRFNLLPERIYLIVTVSFLLIFSTPKLLAQKNAFDVINYNIHLDISDLSKKEFFAATEVTFQAQSTITSLQLSLKGLTVDSILFRNQPVSFSLINELLDIVFGQSVPNGTKDSVLIYYHGKPGKDPSWGGFYFSSTDQGYAFNMGVGFTDYPHNYGRIWFPCVDNFTDKATYTYEIVTAKNKAALCSGVFVDSFESNGKRYWHYRMGQPIPTYLASVAVGHYALLDYPVLGIPGIQTLSGVLPADTVKFKNSFRHLGSCFDIFSKWYYPFQFPRVGFVVVPFSSGAMEHASNIAYPKYAVNGNLSYEYLMAHEFSHHWFGNLVTCATDSDMWLNEGWAVYSEHLFAEKMYGQRAYLEAVRKNHMNVLRFSHVRDGAVYPVSPVPPEVTYGSTVYDKGADVVHALRGYLGDSLFFGAIYQYLDSMKWENASSYDLKNIFSEYAQTPLDNFFDDWVFRKGFPHFYISKQEKQAGQVYRLTVANNPRFNNETYRGVPLEIRFYDMELADSLTLRMVFHGEEKTVEVALPFAPALVLIDPDSKIPDARTWDIRDISSPGSYHFENGLMDVEVKAAQEKIRLVIIHHWNGPGFRLSTGYRLSDYRYWTVRGNIQTGFDASATIEYDGTTPSIPSGGYLDHTLQIDNEDSLVLMYRPNPQTAWTVCHDIDLSTGYKYNKKGSITINHLKTGDYCLAMRDYAQGNSFLESKKLLKIFPNPSNGDIQVKFNGSHPLTYASLVDTNGKTLWTRYFQATYTYTISHDQLPAGTAFLITGDKNLRYVSQIVNNTTDR